MIIYGHMQTESKRLFKDAPPGEESVVKWAAANAIQLLVWGCVLYALFKEGSDTDSKAYRW